MMPADQQITRDRAQAARGAPQLRRLVPWGPDFPQHVVERVPDCGPWFVRGTLPPGPYVAVVGSRAVRPEGVRVCRELVRGLVRAGLAVVSGGAIGVDTIAHETALEAGGRTVAFLPSGFDKPTPRRNRALFERICSQGALLTEYPPDVEARKHHFPRRNQLIAALCRGVVVVRARAHGGTMLTANAAFELGLAVCAVPGSPEDDTAAGCHALIRRGAACVTEVSHVLTALEIKANAAQVELPLATPGLSSTAATLLAAISEAPRSHDELCAIAPVHAVFAALTELEVCGCVEVVDGRFRRATLRPERG